MSTAFVEAIPLDGVNQFIEGANTAVQAVLDGVVNGNPVVPPEQLQQTFESVGALLPAITGEPVPVVCFSSIPIRIGAPINRCLSIIQILSSSSRTVHRACWIR